MFVKRFEKHLFYDGGVLVKTLQQGFFVDYHGDYKSKYQPQGR